MTTKQRATYASMETSTPEDWEIIKNYGSQRKGKVYNSLMAMVKQMALSDDGGPVTGLEHSLQSATRAYEDGADDETVFIALFHDMSGRSSLRTITRRSLRPFSGPTSRRRTTGSSSITGSSRATTSGT